MMKEHSQAPMSQDYKILSGTPSGLQQEPLPKLKSKLAQLATAKPADLVSKGLISLGYSCIANCLALR